VLRTDGDHHHRTSVAADLVLVEQLRERDQGVYEGKRREDLPDFLFAGDHLKAAVPNGESWTMVQDRIASFLDYAYQMHAEHSILLVTHGGVIKAIHSLLSDMLLSEAVSEPVPNGVLWEWNQNRLVGKL
jgi:broad specificity phosphatase PhoE